MMKTTINHLLFAGIALFLAIPSFSQKLLDKEHFQINDSTVLKVGDDLMIGKPAAYDFLNIEEEKSKFGLGKLGSIGNLASAGGTALVLVGIQSGSVGAVTTGLKAMNAGATAASIGMTADAVNALNVSDKAKSIIGKQFRILKFKEEGSDKRGFHYYATVAGEGKTNYRVEIIPAIQSKEILGVNGRIFTQNN